MRVFFIVFYLFYSQSLWAKSIQNDPYGQVLRHIFPNGLTVILSPASSANNVIIDVNIGVGYATETKKERSLFHTLEHTLFRDPDLPANMTYLQVIKEEGGEANGETSPDSTRFYAEMPKQKIEWLVETFNRMIFGHRFDPKFVKFAKKEVLLELGQERNLLEEFLQKISPVEFMRPDFWESEFGVERFEYDSNHEIINTSKIDLEQLEAAYERFYRPDNTTVTIAGNFHPKKLLKLVSQTFGSLPKKSGPYTGFSATKHRRQAYKRSYLTSDHPSMTLGTKFYKTSLKEVLVLSIYYDFLAHRLMKEIRNRSGDTYTAYPIFNFKDHYGYAGVNLNVPKEKFWEYRNLLYTWYQDETQAMNFSQEQFQEAMKLYSRKFRLLGADAQTAMNVAKVADFYYHLEKQVVSPYNVYQSLSHEEFQNILTEATLPEVRYEIETRAPLLFRNDQGLFVLVVIALCVFWMRARLLRPFEYRKLRWVRKIKYTPLSFLKLSLGASLLLSFLSLQDYFLKTIWFHFGFNQYFLMEEYVLRFIEAALNTVTILGFLCLIPRKMMIVDDQLIFKSLTYFSWSIPLQQIAQVEFLSTKKALSRLNLKLRIYHFSLSRYGLFLKLHSGHSYFVYVKDSLSALDDLNYFISQSKANERHLKSQNFKLIA